MSTSHPRVPHVPGLDFVPPRPDHRSDQLEGSGSAAATRCRLRLAPYSANVSPAPARPCPSYLFPSGAGPSGPGVRSAVRGARSSRRPPRPAPPHAAPRAVGPGTALGTRGAPIGPDGESGRGAPWGGRCRTMSDDVPPTARREGEQANQRACTWHRVSSADIEEFRSGAVQSAIRHYPPKAQAGVPRGATWGHGPPA